MHAGSDPVASEVLGGFLIPDRDARRLRIATRASGDDPWLTLEEQARRREEQAREGERAALRRVAELEAELRRR